jgi:cellulose synthase/poly-beta-1,6-N-acetylglucosamine synthase-like glycosyltransferase
MPTLFPNLIFLKKVLPALQDKKVGLSANTLGTSQQRLFTSPRSYRPSDSQRTFFYRTIRKKCRWLYFMNFNGTAGIWRKECIADAGGWQSDTLTEDLDLSYRAQLKRMEIHLPGRCLATPC